MVAASASLAVCACVAAGGAGVFGFASVANWRRRSKLRQRRDELSGAAGVGGRAFAVGGLAARVLDYATGLERRVSLGATSVHAPVRLAGEPHGLLEVLRRAGLVGALGVAACAEARLRLAVVGLLVGALAGALLSNELAALLGVAGACAGIAAVPWALRGEARARVAALEQELPEMLEVVALGLRSGLTFDRSLALYCQHFDTSFSRACASAQRQWSLGLRSREEALRELASSYDSALFARVVESMVRSLRFGSSLAQGLESAAAEARAVHRARREEQVAKAPVKMMVPTAALILPAMLILVLGPILLELMEGF